MTRQKGKYHFQFRDHNLLVYLVLSGLCFFLFIQTAFTQDDTLKNEYQKEFDQFKKETQAQFDKFKSENDSIFYQFLLESWESFELLKDEKAVSPKPDIQPVLKDYDEKPIEIVPMKSRTMLEDSGRSIQFELAPKNFNTYNVSAPKSSINFYGTRIEVYNARVNKISGDDISKETIAEFFRNTVINDELVYSFYDLQTKSRHYKLNGWGFLRLLQEASGTYYRNVNEQVLLTWAALVKTGHDARVGFDKEDIYLLVNFDVPVFYKMYLMKENTKYYLIPFEGQNKQSESIKSFAADYPAKLSTVSLKIKENPIFETNKGQKKVSFNNQKLTLHFNQNIVDFYKTYPDCDLSIYFPPPLSKIALESIGDKLGSKIVDENPLETVNSLLSFVQYAFDYKTDENQFGYENYLFSEETLYYDYADCEDRTVLLSQLIDHFADLNTIALSYPGHVTLAVNIPGMEEGSYVTYKGEKYFVCDPTYIGAQCGMLMPELRKENPELIVY